jgi:hypothetical protein
MEDLPNSSTCPSLLKNQISGKRAGGEYMPLFGMCATSERRAGAGPSERNRRSRWLLKDARGPICASQRPYGPARRVIDNRNAYRDSYLVGHC